MADKVTIQDIADAVGVSRNTVSKAINNTGVLADATREKILQKAIEMGYKQFSYVNVSDLSSSELTLSIPQDNEGGEIALLTSNFFMGSSHFANVMLDKFQQEIAQFGYSLTIHRVDVANIASLQLPISFNKERTAGIICFEIFNYDYAAMLCNIAIPILFVDGPVRNNQGPLNADFLLMDNTTHIHSIVFEMAKRKKTRIGFVGEINHCRSFCERFLAFRDAMYLAGLPINESYCFIENSKKKDGNVRENYHEYLRNCLKELDELPDLFICANDFVAMDLLEIFSGLNISVPKDVYLCGFDDSPESRLLSPNLTTIHIHTQIMGFSAAHLLLSRIKEPYLINRTIYTDTDIIYRESTEG